MFNVIAEMQCMRTYFKQPLLVRIFVVAKLFAAPSWLRELRSRQSHLVRSRRVSGFWRRAAIQKKEVSRAGVASYGQAELGRKPFPWQYRRIQKIQRLKVKFKGWLQDLYCRGI